MNKVFYDDIWEYVKDADISNYTVTGKSYKNNIEYVIAKIDVSEDPTLFLGSYYNNINKDGKKYRSINWGESEKSYILESEIKNNWGEFWTIYFVNHEKYELNSNGVIFKNEEEAEKYLKNDNISEDNYIIEYNY